MNKILNNILCFFGKHNTIKIEEYNNYGKKVIIKCVNCKKYIKEK